MMRTEIRAAWNRTEAAKQNALLFSSDRLVSMLNPPFRFYHFGSTYLNLRGAKKVTSAKKHSRFLPKNVEKLVYNLRISPNRIDEDGSRFGYQVRTREGKRFILVEPEKKKRQFAFDHMRLAGRLIKANKDLDLLIIPNRTHGLGDHPYFIHKRWDYFVKHLLGVDPPKEYKITGED